MKTGRLLMVVFLALFSTTAFSAAWGAQVVTDDARAWAKKALEDEQSLKAAVAPNTLAVLYFFNLTKQADLDPLQKGIAVMLITDLSKVKSLTVVERIRLQALAEEMKLGDSGLVNEKTAPRVGKLLGAEWLVGGSIAGGLPSLLQIKSNVLDVPTAQISGQSGVQGMLEDLLRMEKELVNETIKSLKIKPTPQEEMELKKPITTNAKALVEFSKCIDESDRKKYRDAADFCKAALLLDPAFGLALTTLNELTTLGVTGAALPVATATTSAATAAGVPAAVTAAGVAAGVGGIVGGGVAAGTGGGTAPVSPF
jgi:TolB-like protein